jgi:hypothetical protein
MTKCTKVPGCLRCGKRFSDGELVHDMFHCDSITNKCLNCDQAHHTMSAECKAAEVVEMERDCSRYKAIGASWAAEIHASTASGLLSLRSPPNRMNCSNQQPGRATLRSSGVKKRYVQPRGFAKPSRSSEGRSTSLSSQQVPSQLLETQSNNLSPLRGSVTTSPNMSKLEQHFDRRNTGTDKADGRNSKAIVARTLGTEIDANLNVDDRDSETSGMGDYETCSSSDDVDDSDSSDCSADSEDLEVPNSDDEFYSEYTDSEGSTTCSQSSDWLGMDMEMNDAEDVY